MGFTHLSQLKIRGNPTKAEDIEIERISKALLGKRAHALPRKKGGDLGWFRKGMMVREFDNAVWSIPLATTSEPVKSQFGYHLIWVHEREED